MLRVIVNQGGDTEVPFNDCSKVRFRRGVLSFSVQTGESKATYYFKDFAFAEVTHFEEGDD